MSARRSWRSEAIRRAETMALSRRLKAARDAERAPGETERIKTACRDAVRLAIRTTYSDQERSMTQQDTEEPIKQNVPTTLACPKCGGDVLIMTRKADRRRFLACRNFYDERVRCDYTENSLPQYLLMKEAGATPLPGRE